MRLLTVSPSRPCAQYSDDVAFDNRGRKFDQTGAFSNWWSNATVEAFKERAQCFVDQYNKFTITGPDGEIHLKAEHFLPEAIADAGGLSASFQAWKKLEEEHPEPGLPGLENFTQEQLFFISFGRFWCTKETPDIAALWAGSGHPPAFARIKVCFSFLEQDEFADLSDREQPTTPPSSRRRSTVLTRSRFARSGRCLL